MLHGLRENKVLQKRGLKFREREETLVPVANTNIPPDFSMFFLSSFFLSFFFFFLPNILYGFTRICGSEMLFILIHCAHFVRESSGVIETYFANCALPSEFFLSSNLPPDDGVSGWIYRTIPISQTIKFVLRPMRRLYDAIVCIIVISVPAN